MNRKTSMLGIAGDSASGKTTSSKGIVEARGAEQVTAIIEQGTPGFVEGGTSSFAQEECDAQFAFQLGDGVG